MKRYEKYGRKVSWIVKRYGKCGRKVSWITLCPAVRRNNSVSEGNNSVIGDITLYVGNKLQLCMCNDNIKVGEITLYVEV